MSKSNSPKKTCNASGVTHTEYRDKVLGGLPPKKKVEQIDADTRPRANGRVNGSVAK